MIFAQFALTIQQKVDYQRLWNSGANRFTPIAIEGDWNKGKGIYF